MFPISPEYKLTGVFSQSQMVHPCLQIKTWDIHSLEGKLTKIAVVLSNIGHVGMDQRFDSIDFHVVTKYFI